MPAVASMIPSPPFVWAELITDDIATATSFYGAVFGWRGFAAPGTTDMVVHLDVARTAGPICGIRPRNPTDPRPEGGAIDPTVDRWNVRLSPPRPPYAADPAGDQLLRPRSPGPRLGRWASPSSLCFAELRTQDVEGARLWLERRLDAIVEAVDPLAAPGLGTLVMQSSVDPSRNVAAIVAEPDPSQVGWVPCVQVPSLAKAVSDAEAAGVALVVDRPVPSGCQGTAAAELTDPGGARFVVVEHGPSYGRR